MDKDVARRGFISGLLGLIGGLGALAAAATQDRPIYILVGAGLLIAGGVQVALSVGWFPHFRRGRRPPPPGEHFHHE